MSQDEREAVELLPCPFCGGEVVHRHALDISDGGVDGIIHRGVSECGMIDFTISTADHGKSVAAAWNTRLTAKGRAMQ